MNLKYKGVGLITGTQQGKTAGFLNIGGRKIDDDPADVLWIGPTKSNVLNVVEPQLEEMIRGCASLSSKRTPGSRRRRVIKAIAGVTWRFAWAGSSTEVSSQPAHTVIVDELDKMKPIPGEGDVLRMAEARKSNFPDGCIVATSTPTEGSVDVEVDPVSGMEHWKVSKPEDIVSAIWKLWQSGTRHEWAVPCQGCGEHFVPRLKDLTGWPAGCTPAVASRNARLVHVTCGFAHEDRHQSIMNAGGMYVAPGQKVVNGQLVGDPPDADWWTGWVSGLMSPWVPFSERARQWVRAARTHDQETIRSTLNTSFAELYSVRGEAPPWEDVLKLSKDPHGTYDVGLVPAGVRMIFLTVDVQKDHLVVVIRGWGVEYESWLIDRLELWGETDQVDVWQRLDSLADSMIDGWGMAAFAVDSGYRPERVYDWCEKRLGRAYATKGKDQPLKLYQMTDIEVLRSGKKVKRGVKLTSFDHGYFKGWVHDRVRWPQDAPGAWHLPRLVGEDYCRQLVGESRMRLASGKVNWVKRTTNDYLDCEALQVLLAHLMGVRNLKHPTAGGQQAPARRGVRSGGVSV